MEELRYLDYVGTEIEVHSGEYAGERGVAESVVLQYEVYKQRVERKKKKGSEYACERKGE